jgi:hypothetical protein
MRQDRRFLGVLGAAGRRASRASDIQSVVGRGIAGRNVPLGRPSVARLLVADDEALGG